MAPIQGKLTATTAVVSLTQMSFPVRVILRVRPVDALSSCRWTIAGRRQVQQ